MMKAFYAGLLTLVVGVSETDARAAAPAPRRVVAVLDGTQSFGSYRRAVNFYDVTEVGETSTGGVFNQTPLFSIWTGYEGSAFNNFEDPETIAVNPANGEVYLLAFDSGAAGVLNPSSNDTLGDLDLYALDYQAALNDFETNGRPRGVMYTPTVAPDGQALASQATGFYYSGSAQTIALSGVSAKIGEVGRIPNSSFFEKDLVYFDPQTLAYADEEFIGIDSTVDDHELRTIDRVSTSPGAAVLDTAIPESVVGGNNNGTVESWESERIGLAFLDGPGSISNNPIDIVAADDGVTRGIWVAERDGGGDDLAFFPLPSAPVMAGITAAKATLESGHTVLELDEDPELDPTTNDGEIDFLKLDSAGNLIIGENGFFDLALGGEAGNGGAPSQEPSVLRLNVDGYGVTNVDLNADVWDDLDEVDGFGPIGTDRAGDVFDPPTQIEGPLLGALDNAFAGGSGLSIDDDAGVTDGRFTTFDPGEGLLYVFDADTSPDFVADAYVIDVDTGEIVYEELDAANHFLLRHGIRFFVRGDLDGDGDVDAGDIDRLAAVANSGNTLDGEEFDLTSDDVTTVGVGSTSDLAELVRGVLGTEFGDANLDGKIDAADFSALAANFGLSGGWSEGDFDGDGLVGAADFSVLASNFGFGSTNGSPVIAVPEPAGIASLAIAVGGFGSAYRRATARRRRRAHSEPDRLHCENAPGRASS